VNANGKRVDAWLIYKCTSCDNTWNRPVLERRHVSTIGPQLLASLQTNDPDLSRRLAFEKLRRKLKVEHFDDATVRKEVVSESTRPADRLEIVCVVPETTGLRVDRLLSTELRLSRNRIQYMQNAGHLAACPDGLRRPLRNGLQVRIELRGVHDGDKIALELLFEAAGSSGLAWEVDVAWLVRGNAEGLPFESGSIDAYSVAFGMRNLTNLDTALSEAYRVLKPGGRFACLEFSAVDVPILDALYDAYSFKAIPALGAIVAGDAPSYRYLVESIRRTAIRYRKDHDGPSLKHLERTIGRLGAAHATNVIYKIEALNLTAAGLGSDTYSNFEGVIGGNFNDTLTGSSSRVSLTNSSITNGLATKRVTPTARASFRTGASS
jgi:hypothetical protein